MGVKLRSIQFERKFPAGRAAGFSLIELLVVVAIILIIAAIAIPNFVRSKMAANEAAAVASVRNVNTAQVVYSTTYGTGYSASLTRLGPPVGANPPNANGADLIDSVLSSGNKSGYLFNYAPGAPDGTGRINTFQFNADPITPGATGTRHFFTDESGVIRQNLLNPAGPADQPI